MISYNRLLEEMEKHMQSAKIASNEQQMREALVAVRALCDVMLLEESPSRQPLPKMLVSQESTMQVQSLASKPFEETDANGKSLFDF